MTAFSGKIGPYTAQADSPFLTFSSQMKVSVQVQTDPEDKKFIRFQILRDGRVESRFSRPEFIALLRKLKRDGLRLAQVQPGKDLTEEIHVQTKR